MQHSFVNRHHVVRRCLLVVLVAGALWIPGTSSRPAAQSRSPVQAPRFEVEPLWPKPLPNHWVLGSLGGIAVDDQDHIWVLNRGSRTLAANFKQLEFNPPWAMCCASAPAVLEFDQAGNRLRHRGGYPGGPGYEWFDQEHGLAVDNKGNVYMGGGTGGDSHILKFTKDGKFVKQFGKRNARLVSGDPNGPARDRVYKANSLDTESLGRPAKIVIDPKTNEAFIADGYLNTRVVVMDPETGKIKRFWGAYGNKPDDSVFEKSNVTGDQASTGYDPAAPPAQQWRHAVHCVMVSKDDQVYVCDRQGDRIQVFTKAGKFVKEAFIAKETRDAGSV